EPGARLRAGQGAGEEWPGRRRRRPGRRRDAAQGPGGGGLMSADGKPPVRLDIAEGIARIVFDRPESLNAINVETSECFLALCQQLQAREDARVIVLSGAGRAFMAGGDLAAFHSADDPAQLASA